ncbi:MAG: rhodanese-like domain-containing protein [Candidatus Woesearchaeota archaeon]
MNTVSREWILNNECWLLDVRTAEELVHGMLPRAHHIPLHDLASAVAMEPSLFSKTYGYTKPSKQTHIVVYCRTGKRSAQAQRLLTSLGYTALNYAGSIWEWSEYDPSVRRYT